MRLKSDGMIVWPERDLATVSTSDLVRQLIEQSTELAKSEIELAKSELRDDIKREIKTAKLLSIAGVGVLATLNMLLVAVVLALAQHIAGWLSALIVAALVLSIGTVAGVVGWAKRVKKPLETTQKTLKDDVRWAKEQLA